MRWSIRLRDFSPRFRSATFLGVIVISLIAFEPYAGADEAACEYV